MHKTTRVPPRLLLNPIHFLSLGFGSGLSPLAPGTAGTLAALPLIILMQQLSISLYLAITLMVCFIGIYLCGETAQRLGVHDHGAIVWDEIAGYMLTMFAAPTGWLPLLMGFVLFRLFDIWKPWPIRLLDQNVSGGIGIMLDDILAALYAAVLLHLILYIMR
ncbi:MAG: phosphatidylglycerophosphatase A [Gammaproteobacteria bacterium]|nr:phosphatidylglycerophosphatase A [Gammaproteobacteria bacterium]MDH5650875.1 phosphatidylglycerophosphatase A [Gammaproteobacteria bacterium]